jgi:hypothetical protein
VCRAIANKDVTSLLLQAWLLSKANADKHYSGTKKYLTILKMSKLPNKLLLVTIGYGYS